VTPSEVEKVAIETFPVWTASVPSPGDPELIFPGDDDGGGGNNNNGVPSGGTLSSPSDEVTTSGNQNSTPAAASVVANGQQQELGEREEEEQNPVRRRICEMKEMFHRGRHLLVKHLPPDVTEQVRDHIVFQYLLWHVRAGPPTPTVVRRDGNRQEIKHWRNPHNTSRVYL
jgi:hypothetical protein